MLKLVTVDIKEILAGNAEFRRKADKNLLKGLAEKGQKPAAAVVACSDSRVPPEVIFDRLTPGSLFIIRVAGNVVADTGVKGSIEYAIEHLHVPYLIVLGHTDCGAVKASLAGTHDGEVGKLLDGMKLKSKDISKAVRENVALQVGRVMALDCVKAAVTKKSLVVYGLLYDLPTGEVKILSKNGTPLS